MSAAPAPPRLAVRLLERVLGNDPAARAILGDLQEDFARVVRARGAGAARRWHWREALLLSGGHAALRTLRTGRRGVAAMASPGLRTLAQDAGYALRALRRRPGFASFTAAVIALGIGAAVTVFSVLEPLILSPLPFPSADRLVWIANDASEGDQASLSAVTSRTANLVDFRERSRTFEGLTGYDAFFGESAYTLTGAGAPERLVGVGVAHDFLDVLGVEPLLGRSFTEAEGLRGGAPAVLLTHGFWRRRFAGDPGIVGRALTLNAGEGDVSHTVVGVLPPTFDFASIFTPGARVDFLLPFRILSAGEGGFQGNVLSMVGRLRPGVSVGAAQADLDGILSEIAAEDPRRWGLGAEVTPLQAHLAGPFRPALLLLAAAAGTLLLIVCVNVSNLLLARAPLRAREMAVRKALGAPRARILRQLVFETLAVSLAGAALGSVLAAGATRVVASAAAPRIPLMDAVRVDAPALLVAGALAVATGLVVGLLPALRVAEGGEARALREGTRGASQSRPARHLREGLVVAEVTLACALLFAGALLVRSFRAVLDVDLGFDPSNTVAWQLAPGGDFATYPEKSAFLAGIAERVGALPGVEGAGLIDALPLGRNRTWPFGIVGVPQEDAAVDRVFPHVVGPGYLEAMRIPLVAGRNVSKGDQWDAPPVVLINESGARRAFPGEDPLGKRIRLFGSREWEVVGVVEDVRHLSPEMGPGVQIYVPLAQMQDHAGMELVVRSPLAVEQIAAAVGAVLREADASMPTGEFWTVRSTVERAVSARRFTLRVLQALGISALVLAGLGIYGVLAQGVAERRHEIGIRMALGASPRGIVWSVLGRTLALAVAGTAAGAALSLAGGRVMASLLYGVSAADPLALGSVALVLLLVAAAAGAVPAARATRGGGLGALTAE
jgi:putative ABC transport system permease protein